MVNHYYRIKQDEGIFKEGMHCYCFAQDRTHLFLFFREAVINGIQEVKLPRHKTYLLKRI